MSVDNFLNTLLNSVENTQACVAHLRSTLSQSQQQQLHPLVTQSNNLYYMDYFANNIHLLSRHIQSLTYQLSQMSPQNQPPCPHASDRATMIAQLLYGTQQTLTEVLNSFFLVPRPAGVAINCVTYNAQHALFTATEVIFEAQSAILKTNWSLFEPTYFSRQLQPVLPTHPVLYVVPDPMNPCATRSQGECIVYMPDGTISRFTFNY